MRCVPVRFMTTRKSLEREDVREVCVCQERVTHETRRTTSRTATPQERARRASSSERERAGRSAVPGRPVRRARVTVWHISRDSPGILIVLI